jgi:hypothetical protein
VVVDLVAVAAVVSTAVVAEEDNSGELVIEKELIFSISHVTNSMAYFS